MFQKHALTQFGEQTSVPQWSGGVATSDPSTGIQACMVCRGFSTVAAEQRDVVKPDEGCMDLG